MAGRARHATTARAGARGTDLVEGQDEMIRAHVDVAAVEGAEAGVTIAVVGDVQLQGGRLAAHEGIARLEAGPRGVDGHHAMEDGHVRGVDAALEPLQPVALLDHLRDVAMRGRRLRPREVGRRRPSVGGAEVSPDDTARFHRGIAARSDLVRELELRGLVHHVDATAVHVELPAVVDAAEPTLLVPPEEERGLAMRAALVEEPDAAAGVTKGDQLLAEQLHAHGRTISLW